MRAPRTGEVVAPPPWRQAAMGGFVLFNVFAIVLWCMPLPERARERLRVPLTGYMIASGLHQDWGMFAPDPTTINDFVEAEIAFRDGRRIVWRFPSTEGTGYTRRYFVERYRKWANDHVRVDQDAAIWPDAARYAAWVNNDPQNPPVHVRLVRHWSTIQLPGVASAWSSYPYFDYDVTPGDLR